MKLWPPVKRIPHQGWCEIPKWYGVCYQLDEVQVVVVAWVPLNLLIRAWHEFRLFCKNPLRSWKSLRDEVARLRADNERLLDTMWEADVAGLRAASDRGYERAMSDLATLASVPPNPPRVQLLTVAAVWLLDNGAIELCYTKNGGERHGIVGMRGPVLERFRSEVGRKYKLARKRQ